MKKILIALVLLITANGCVQQPTAITQIADTSPTINFSATTYEAGLELFVDGISYGLLSQYLAPKQALKLVPGKHVIEIKTAQVIVFSTHIYLSESTHRTIETNL